MIQVDEIPWAVLTRGLVEWATERPATAGFLEGIIAEFFRTDGRDMVPHGWTAETISACIRDELQRPGGPDPDTHPLLADIIAAMESIDNERTASGEPDSAVR